MNGEVRISLKTTKLSYDLCFERNISVILGDSGSGKSLLCTLLSQAQEGDGDIKMTLSGAGNYVVMPEKTEGSQVTLSWKHIVRRAENTIFFIDEFCDCLHSGDFAEAVKHTSNYYVLITREPHGELPYSIHAIYTLDQEVGGELVKIVNVPFHHSDVLPCVIDYYITEDSGAGNLFVNMLFGVTARGAGSKTKVRREVGIAARKGAAALFVMADGAAFGSEYLTVVGILDACRIPYILYLPESFEWLLLHSQVFASNTRVSNILQNFLNIVDYTKFFSLEKFFTAMFKYFCSAAGLRSYDKGKGSLDHIFLEPSNLLTIKNFIASELQGIDFFDEALGTDVFGE